MGPVDNKFTILFGSQTGQAKAIAEEIHERSEQHGVCSKLLCLSLTEKKFNINKEKLVVFVVSTTGEGDAPETMSKFWRRLKKKTLPSNYLENCHYALLALGDTNYTNFCNCGKSLDKRMQALGAKHFYETGYADDAVGLELVVEPWIEGLWPALRKHLCLDPQDGEVDSQSVKTHENNEELLVVDQLSSDMKEGSMPSSTKANTGDSAVLESTSSIPVITSSDDNVVPEKIVGISSSIEHLQDRNKIQNAQDEARSNLSINNKPELNKNGPSTVTEKTLVDNKSESTPRVSESEDHPSIWKSQAPLSTCILSVPLLPAAYLALDFHPDKTFNPESVPLQGGASFPGAVTEVSMATIVSARRLTNNEAVKTALNLELDIADCNLKYEPGDSFGIVCPNNECEVDELIQRLCLCEKADVPFTVKVMESTSKKTAKVPEHIPQLCTIRHALVTCLEIRTIPKKAFLRVLVDHTSDSLEKRRLQELCSKQGAGDYAKFIRGSSMCLLDILKAFPSCNPPFERLLEQLPRLMPRPYSMASSPLQRPNRMHFLFNIVQFPALLGIREKRLGVCTGWLDQLTARMQQAANESKSTTGEELCEGVTRLNLSGISPVPVFGRKNLHFKMPADPATPILMIGPGTGIAPFIGFLQHREHQRKNCGLSSYGPMWLFFGCRHKNRDFLYRDELEHHLSTGALTKLFVSFSRDGQDNLQAHPLPCYVQHNLQQHSTAVADLIFSQGAVVYICGDAKNMARNVLETFLEIFQQYKGISLEEARKELMKLRTEERYHEDVWT